MAAERELGTTIGKARFGCGAFLSGILAFLLALNNFSEFSAFFWALVLAAAVSGGLLAKRYGDAFWDRLGGLLDWWRRWP